MDGNVISLVLANLVAMTALAMFFAKIIRAQTKAIINESAVTLDDYMQDRRADAENHKTMWDAIEKLRLFDREFGVIKEKQDTLQKGQDEQKQDLKALQKEITAGFSGLFNEVRGSARH